MTPPATGGARHQDLRIAMADGARLAARLWLPAGQDGPVPAVLECHPYRLRDASVFDRARHEATARHGLASLQVDLRGTGDSEGVLLDEYLASEQDDIAGVVRYLRAQPWCSGRVGMYGMSWGGFAALQVAARSDVGIDAVAVAFASDDRYADDVHYIGGSVIGSDMLSWSTTMLAYNARPPDPRSFGEGWERAWRERLDALQPWVETWLRHQHDDAYWRHGSVGRDLDAIECPMLVIGGWADGYRNALPRLLRPRRRGVTQALIGPWPHRWPDQAVPGPRIDLVGELVTWWEHWLGGIDRGVTERPAVRAFLPAALPPGTPARDREGIWVGLDGFAPAGTTVGLALDGSGGGPGPGPGSAVLEVGGDQAPERPAATFFSSGPDPLWSTDQSEQDALDRSFTSPPLEQPLDVVGVPEVELSLSPGSRGPLIVRLCTVWPGGGSSLLARGVVDIDREAGAGGGMPAPDRSPTVVALSATSVTVPAGHRLRVALSTAAWPLVWPRSGRQAVGVDGSSVVLRVPAIDGAAAEVPAPPGPPPGGPPAVTWSGPLRQPVCRALRVGGVESLTISRGYPAPFIVDDSGLSYDDWGTDELRIVPPDPASAWARATRTIVLGRGHWAVRIEAEATMTATDGELVVEAALAATESGRVVARRHWAARIARDRC